MVFLCLIHKSRDFEEVAYFKGIEDIEAGVASCVEIFGSCPEYFKMKNILKLRLFLIAYIKIDVQNFCSQKHILKSHTQERTKSSREIFQLLAQSVLFIRMMSSFPIILIMNSIAEAIIRKVSGRVGILIMDYLCLPSSLTDIVQLQGYKQVYPNLRCGWIYFFWYSESSGSMFQVKYYLNSKIYTFFKKDIN